MTAKYLKPLPIVGNQYHFWDDGKTNPGSHYICRCERIITSEEAKNIMFEIPNYYNNDVMDTISLYEHWPTLPSAHSPAFSSNRDNCAVRMLCS